MKKRIALFVSLLLATALTAQAQHPPFWDDIQAFRKKDSLNKPAGGQILFIGSSSFTKWTDVQKYFPGYPLINRGFGGSTLPDLVRYADDIILPYDPKQVVIYCGDNDLASSDTVTAVGVLTRFRKLFGIIRSYLPGVSVLYVSIKPSPSRAVLLPKMDEANKLIAAFLKRQHNTVFIDVFHPMLGDDGQPLPGIFLEDQLHMNAKGYAIWKKALAPYLLN